jgi:hypothetical protein
MSQFHRYLWSTLALAFVLSLGSTAHAATYVVGSCSANPNWQGPDGLNIVLGDTPEYTPLQAGDTIEVCPSPIQQGDNVVYTDNVTITKVPKKAKPFVNCLTGEQEVIDTTGDWSEYIGFLVLSSGVTIENLVIDGCIAGIVDPGPGFEIGWLSGEIPATLNSLKAPYNTVHPNSVGPLQANVDPQWKTKGSKGHGKSNKSCPAKDVYLCVESNDIEGNLLGVLTFGVGDVDIDSNLFSGNAFGAVVTFDGFTNQITNNNVTGFNDVSSNAFFASAGIFDVDGNQDKINSNKVLNTGIAVGLESLFTGTQQTQVKSNTTKYNAVGLEVDLLDFYFDYLTQQSSQNTFSSNTSKNNLPVGSAYPDYLTGNCADFTSGGGTAGTADTWKSNSGCKGQSITLSGAQLQ